MVGQEKFQDPADAVADQWRRLLEQGEGFVDPAMVRAAYAEPRLRALYPGVGLEEAFALVVTSLPDDDGPAAG